MPAIDISSKVERQAAEVFVVFAYATDPSSKRTIAGPRLGLGRLMPGTCRQAPAQADLSA